MRKTASKSCATNATRPNAPKSANNGARVLLLDIESSPILGYVWRKWQTDVLHVVEDWKLLMVGYKWLHEKDARVLSGRFLTELELCAETHKLLDKADIVVAHNGDSFDVKKLQAKFAEYHFSPPSPFKTVDTCRIAKNHFGFSSNKLDDLGVVLGKGRKVDTGGFRLWLDVMGGDKSAWKHMEDYCKRDVVLLERIYHELKPWTPRHPNMAVYNNSGDMVCSCCGGSEVEETVNKYYTNSSAYRKYRCLSCGAWSRLRKADGVVRPSSIMCDRK